MKMNNILVPVFALALPVAIPGCGTGSGASSETTPATEFYSGKFAVNETDGMLSFTDCATYVRMEVEGGLALEQTRKVYSENIPAAGTAVLIEFTGRMITPEGMNDPSFVPGSQRPKVMIDSLISFTPERDCRLDTSLSGIYESERDDGDSRMILRLRPDYTFSQSHFGKSGEETTASGTWYRSALMTVVLRFTDGIRENESYQFIPTREALSKNSGGDARVFTKVYL